MKSGYSKSTVEKIKGEIRTLAEDMLYSYKEILDNTLGLYDEDSAGLPLYTTSERLLETFEKEIGEILSFYRKD